MMTNERKGQSRIDINLKYWVGIWCWTLFYTESGTSSCINHNIQVENLEIIIQYCTITRPLALTCYFKAGTGCLAPYVHVHCPVKWLQHILGGACPAPTGKDSLETVFLERTEEPPTVYQI